jgi:tRNA A-37 threonylcarbamoyl transferase component Bud32
MQLACPKCTRVLEYSGERPSFCAYCGQALADTIVDPTAPFHEAPTLAHAGPDESGPGSIPDTIGGYRLCRPLGRGGMGSVYEAEEIASGRRVAVKLIAPEFTVSGATVERFRQEGRLASAISHPRCVFVFAADEEAGRPYIVMELMPGLTLGDIVAKQGALPPGQAIAKILDVIDGLEEAHRLGVIHRDVKPGNCFVDKDDRVKVGDFGLARSLEADSQLTRSGTFLGTVLYASPEQIRKETLDEQTDVYSVAGTLYFLLTGQAPFQGGDAAATLARIVADPVPSMRTIRPEISPTLDQVVLRGLERQRERRWRSMVEFRQALLPFVPGHLSMGSMGVRFAAFLVDYLAITTIGSVFGFLIMLTGLMSQGELARRGLRWEGQLLSVLPWFVYFAVPEALWNCSFGKCLLRLRVFAADGGGHAPVWRILLRTAIFYGLLHPGSLALATYAAIWAPGLGVNEVRGVGMVAVAVLGLVGFLFGLTAILAPMRARNGYRGLHEILSGTRVLRLPWPQPIHRTREGGPILETTQPLGMPAQIGPYRVTGAARWTPALKLLIGEDTILHRKVWICMRPLAEPALGDIRRAVSRTTRTRWLNSGTSGGEQWDAFVAPSGSRLTALVAKEGRLSWSEARACLEQLADELLAALKEGTLPPTLAPEQVILQPNGAAQLVDFPVEAQVQPAAEPGILEAVAVEDGGEKQAIELLRQSALLMLEGRTRPADVCQRIEAPLPGAAGRCMSKLLTSDGRRYPLEKVRADLLALREQPSEVNRQRRTVHLIINAGLLGVGLLFMFGAGWFLELADVFMGTVWTWEAESALVRPSRVVGDSLLFSTQPSALSRILDSFELNEDLQRRAELRQMFDEVKPRLDARKADLSWYSRYYAQQIAKRTEMAIARKHAGLPHDEQWAPLEMDVETEAPGKDPGALLKDQAEMADFHEGVFFVLLCIVVAYPVMWMLWAFVVRGGISYRIAGITLARSNGRPAWRLQCAWRALLVWAPITLLLSGSLWLDRWIWSGWSVEAPPSWWIRWLPDLLWGLAALLLAGYAALALWQPTRTLHDRLAGTYLVPR